MCNKPQAIIGPLPSQNWNMQSSSTGLRPLVRFSGGTIPQLKMANLLSNKKHHGQHLLDKCRRSESTVVGLSPNSSFVKEYFESDDQQKQFDQQQRCVALWRNGQRIELLEKRSQSKVVGSNSTRVNLYECRGWIGKSW